MTLPNFLIIGAPKAGTTSLYYYLEQHPNIFMSPVKEPRFFSPNFYTTYYTRSRTGSKPKPAMRLEEYHQLFANVTDQAAVGEASPDYLFFPDSPDRIKQLLPQGKLVAILRDPAERAFSAYSYNVRDGMERLSFERGLQEEARRMEARWRPGWFYVQQGLYHTQLQRYFERFDRSQVKILLFEDLSTDSARVCREVFGFLEVDPDFRPDLAKQNESRTPKSPLLNRLLMRNKPLKAALKRMLPGQLQKGLATSVNQLNFKAKTVLPQETRAKLIEVFREEVLRLQDLIQRDLSQWLR